MAKKQATVKITVSSEDLAKLRKVQIEHGYKTIDEAARHAFTLACILYDQSPYGRTGHDR